MAGGLKIAPNAGSKAVWYRAIRFGGFIALLGFALSLIPFVAALEENAGLDWLFQNRGYRTPPPAVAVVSIDKRSADRLKLPGEPRLWPRSLHAALIDTLVAADVAVIAFDIYFDKPREPDSDALLGDSIAAAGNVILFEYLKKEILPGAAADGGDIITEQLVRPIKTIGAGALITAAFPLPVVPVKVSRFWTFTTGGGDVATLPVAAFQAFVRDVQPEFNELLRAVNPQLVDDIYARGVGDAAGWETRAVMSALRRSLVSDPTFASRMLKILATRPDDEMHRRIAALINLYAGPNGYYLNFYGPPRTVQTVSYSDVLAIGTAARGLAGKVVFVGYSADMQPDQKDSFYSVYSQDSGLNLSGVEIAATAFANLYEGTSVRPLAGWYRFALLVGWGLLAGMAAYLLTPILSTLAAMLLGGGYLWLSAAVFAGDALWLPLAVPLMQLLVAWVSMQVVKLLVTRSRFGQFVPRAAVDMLTSGSADTSGDWAYRVLLSADVAGYTGSSERYTRDGHDGDGEQRSEALWQLMNEYFTVLNQTVESHGGLICDQEGDSSIAVWEAGDDELAARTAALESALAIHVAIDNFHATRIREFNKEMQARFGESHELQLPTRVGVHAGRVRMGKIGGGHHYEFHVFGDPVNTVSRIQQHNKVTGTRMLVSAEALDGVENAVAADLGAVKLRGKAEPLRLFALERMG